MTLLSIMKDTCIGKTFKKCDVKCPECGANLIKSYYEDELIEMEDVIIDYDCEVCNYHTHDLNLLSKEEVHE